MTVLTVLLGAGASYDCVDAHNQTVECRPDWRPPLVNELFSLRPSFAPILHQYPKAEALADEVRRTVLHPNAGLRKPLERHLLDAMNSGHPSVRKRYLQVPLYLQDLIGAVSDQFVIHGVTLHSKLVAEIANAVHRGRYSRVLFLTVNYDLFLDRALESLYDQPLRTFEDYVRNPEWGLVKLHGSVNWGREVGRVNGSPYAIPEQLEYLNTRPAEDLLSGELVHLIGYKYRAIDMLFRYPALAVPVEGKSGFVCPRRHAEFATQLLAEPSDFLICGCRMVDQGVLDLFKLAAKPQKLLIVGRDKNDAIEVLTTVASHCPTFNAYRGRDNATHERGFADFVANNHLANFLS